MKSYLLTALLTCLFVLKTIAQDGTPDSLFGYNGLVAAPFFEDLSSSATEVAFSGDGRIYTGGYTRIQDDSEHAIMQCFFSDGTPDHSFNGNGKKLFHLPLKQSYTSGLFVYPDHKVLVAIQTYDNEGSLPLLYRLHPDGSPDESFHTDSLSALHYEGNSFNVKAMAVQSDGKILLAGYGGFTSDTFNEVLIVRLLANGLPDPDFGENGLVHHRAGESYSSIYDVKLQTDGKILITGYCVINGYETFLVMRFTEDGVVDDDFGNHGLCTVEFNEGDDRAIEAAVQPDGKIVLGGYAFSQISQEWCFAAARLHEDGTPDPAFNGNGSGIYLISHYSDNARSMVLQPDGKILLGGYVHSDKEGGPDMAIMRLNPNGIPDHTFDGDGVAIFEDQDNSSSLLQIRLQPDGKIVGTGFSHLNGVNHPIVVRFHSGLIISSDSNPVSITETGVYPNPAHQSIVISYKLDQHEYLSVNMYDHQGKFVQTLSQPSLKAAGDYVERFDIPLFIAPGIYVVTLETHTGKKAMQVVIN